MSIKIPQRKVMPTTEPSDRRVLIPENIFSGEFAAQRGYGQALSQRGNVYAGMGQLGGNVAVKMLQLRAAKETADAETSYLNSLDEFELSLLADPEYLKAPDKFQEFHKTAKSEILQNVTTANARREVTRWLKHQGSRNYRRISFDTHTKMAVEAKQTFPYYLENRIGEYVKTTNVNDKQKILTEINQKIQSYQDSGLFSSEVADTWRLRLKDELAAAEQQQFVSDVLAIAANIRNEDGDIDLAQAQKYIDSIKELDEQTKITLKERIEQADRQYQLNNQRAYEQAEADAKEQFNGLMQREDYVGAIDFAEKLDFGMEGKWKIRQEDLSSAWAKEAQAMQYKKLSEGVKDEVTRAAKAGKSLEEIDKMIESAPVDEDIQRKLENYAEEKLKEPVLTNEPLRAKMHKMALDVGTGAVEIAEFRRELEAVKDKLSDDPEERDASYRTLINKAEEERDKSVSDLLAKMDKKAGRLIVDYREEDAFADYLAQMARGMKPDIRTLFENKANENRKLQFMFLDQFNNELLAWVRKNKDASLREMEQKAEEKKVYYYNAAKEGEIEARLEEVTPEMEEVAKKVGGEKPTADELKAQARTTNDMKERKRIYEQGKKLGYWE